MLEQLKQDVYRANMQLKEFGLVVLTWGNVSAIDRKSGLVVIKPSGVPYDTMKAEDMVVVDLDGNVVEGTLNPYKRIFNRLKAVFAPTKRSVPVNKHRRTVIRIYTFVFKAFDYDLACVELIFALNLSLCKTSCTRYIVI